MRTYLAYLYFILWSIDGVTWQLCVACYKYYYCDGWQLPPGGAGSPDLTTFIVRMRRRKEVIHASYICDICDVIWNIEAFDKLLDEWYCITELLCK